MTDFQQPRTRQELYDRIRQTSKERYILEEMIRLGFWPAEGQLPNDPADEIRRQEEIRQELETLRSRSRALHNEKQIRKRLLQERLKESRRKQQETKERRERDRQERAAAWQRRKSQEILYLGPGVSGGLGHHDSDLARLQRYGLPELSTPDHLAAALGISLGQVRFLAFSRRVAPISHYIRFRIPKKTGGERLISAPMPRLKQVQYWILKHILNPIPVHEAAHGFRQDRSIVSNARPHVGSEVVINLDLKDFFPSIAYPRVKGLFRSVGYSESLSTILGLICTEPDVEEVELDGRIYYVALSDRHLPQGAPTSPGITNLLCRRLDQRLTEMATACGFIYTRYADDLTFSASGESLRNICNILKRSQAIVSHEGFQIHDQKTRILRRSQQQEVTGIVVNEKLNIPKETLKRFRATLYQIEKDGLVGKQWGGATGVDLLHAIQGFASYIMMVNPEKGEPFQQQVRRIWAKYR